MRPPHRYSGLIFAVVFATGLVSELRGQDLISREDLLEAWTPSRSIVKPESGSHELKRETASRGIQVVKVDVDTETEVAFRFQFEKDSIEFTNKDNAYRQLRQIAEAVAKLTGERFMVAGHTCDLGTDAHNDRLSMSRANLIKEVLVRMGVTESQLEWGGAGETAPMVENNSEANRRLNRRVIFARLSH